MVGCPTSLTGNEVGLMVVRRSTRLGMFVPMVNKHSLTVREALHCLKIWQQAIWRFHSDGGREFLAHAREHLRD